VWLALESHFVEPGPALRSVLIELAITFVTGVALTAAAACGGGDPAPTDVQMADSAGVEIIASAAPTWRAAHAWTISEAPLVEIGTQGSDTLHHFAGLIDVACLSHGRFAVANRRPYLVWLYSADGKYLRGIGRQGEGPGEYVYISRVHRLPGDSIMVATERGINSVFSVDGAAAGSMRLERAPRDFSEFAAIPWAAGAFSDGSILIAGKNTECHQERAAEGRQGRGQESRVLRERLIIRRRRTNREVSVDDKGHVGSHILGPIGAGVSQEAVEREVASNPQLDAVAVAIGLPHRWWHSPTP